MARNRALVGLLVGMTAAAGCRGKDVALAPERAPLRKTAPSATDEARDVCLADPGGGGPLDGLLRAEQGRARERSQKSDEWVAVGRDWVRKARLDSDPGFYVNVEACTTVALALESDYVPALVLQSLVRMNDHRFEEARAIAERILAEDAENPVALGTLSDALLELGRYDEAAVAAQRQAAVRPGMAAYSRGSYIRWLKGDDRTARLLIREALQGRDARDPEPAAWTFVEAANLFWHLGDYPGSDAVYTKALEWVPDYPSALVGRARIAIAREQPRQALELLEKAYRLRPLPETAWLQGDAHEMLGDKAGADEAFARVVQQGRRGDKLTLALFYATKDRDLDEALRLIEEERKSRGGIHVEDTYAWVLFRRGQVKEARAASDRATRLGTKEARLLYHAGAIRMAAGDVVGGRTWVRRALALNPRFDWTGASEAHRLLETRPRQMAAR